MTNSHARARSPGQRPLFALALAALTLGSSTVHADAAEPSFESGRTWQDGDQTKVQRDEDEQPSIMKVFPIPRQPEVGVARINFFIPEAWIRDNAYGVDVDGEGNGRGFDPSSNAFQSKAAIELDFEAGEGKVLFTPSCVEFPLDALCQMCSQSPAAPAICDALLPPEPPFLCDLLSGRTQRKCNEPHPIGGMGDNFFQVTTTTRGGASFYVDMHMSAANAFSDVAFRTALTCAIDDYIRVNWENGALSVTISGDNYPSAEAYWYRATGGAPQEIYRRVRDDRGPIALCDDPPDPLPPPQAPSDGCSDQERANAAAFGCNCKDGQPFGGYCEVGPDGCNVVERENANAFGCDCKDGQPFGGYCTIGEDGCNVVERENANAFGCDCKDGKPFGGYCAIGEDGCNVVQRENANAFGCDCKDGQPFGGYCAIGEDGCNVVQRENANAYGCDCKDGKPFGGYCAIGADGCTVVERENANKFGCDCKNGKPFGGYCGIEPIGADGCTDTERANAARYGCDCKDHKPFGGYCVPVGPDGCTDSEREIANSGGCDCKDHKPIGGLCSEPTVGDDLCTDVERENARRRGCGCYAHDAVNCPDPR